MRKLVCIMSIMVISGGVVLLGLNFASANVEDKKIVALNNISAKNVNQTQYPNKPTEQSKSIELVQTKNYNVEKENNIQEIEKDLNNILNKGKYTYDWEDKLDHKYGDDWDDFLENKHGDDWEDKFESKLKKVYGAKYKDDNDDDDKYDHDDKDDNHNDDKYDHDDDDDNSK